MSFNKNTVQKAWKEKKAKFTLFVELRISIVYFIAILKNRALKKVKMLTHSKIRPSLTFLNFVLFYLNLIFEYSTVFRNCFKENTHTTHSCMQKHRKNPRTSQK